MSDEKIKVGISQGDINGIGLEVILKTLMEPGITEICTPVLFSSQKTVSYHRKALNLDEFNFNPIRDFSQFNNKKVNVFVCYEEEVNIEIGKATELSGKYALNSLEKATQALLNNQVDVLVTGPIHKHNIQSAEFNFPGHTEYLGAKLGGEPLMLLTSDDLKVAVVTGHVPLKDVASKISSDKVYQKINQLYKSLKEDFGIRKPKIAVLGLNPHAGDNGVIGVEDKELIAPAVQKALDENKLVYGPYSADGFFGKGLQSQFDAVLAMYHDQGLIPFKTLAFNSGVNFTAGLNYVRTSPDHGTGYDIAGKNLADESSFKKAIYTAIDIYKNRKLYQEINANPLQHTTIKKER
ncbi:MAG: 4-hydroxythreonine-4-phosphate dehydrogenase PdxA [Bacteroidetes bacterium]|nr:4-hydroxythreonine-4-phosphate dehydrogenase PdxA [Bacteroidota bacterium]